MVETGHTHLFDIVVLVTAPLELRIERVMRRDGVDRISVQKRMDRQWSDERKKEFADIIIENVDKGETLRIVRDLWTNNFKLN